MGHGRARQSLRMRMITRSELLRGKNWVIEKLVFAQFDLCGRFSQVELMLWLTLSVRNLHFSVDRIFQERTECI